MKKKILAAILGGMLVLSGVNISYAPVTAQATEELTYGDFTYTLSGGLTITGYTGDGGTVVIPDQINGVNVTKIGWNAFKGCASISSIILPAKLQEIGGYAFDGTGITSISLPKTLTKAENAFDGADQLISAEFESGATTVPSEIFDTADNLTTVMLPDSITEIESDSFRGCKRLTTINLPDKITKIGWNVFNGCTSLSDIKLPAKLQEIGGYAFNETGITSISLPKTLTKAENAFDGADQLISAEFESGATTVPSEIFDTADNLTTVTLPDSITEIESDSFRGCAKLTTINIPGKVTKIGWNSFNGCTSLNKVTLSSKLRDIGDYAFEGCDSLTIYGPKNSYAQTYAQKNNIPFVESSYTSSTEPSSSDDYTNNAPTVTIKSLGKNNVKIKYSKPENTSKFEFNYRKKGASSWKKKTTTKTSVNLKGLKRKTNYQIRVRSIRTVDGTDYSGTWSVIKTVKTK